MEFHKDTLLLIFLLHFQSTYLHSYLPEKHILFEILDYFEVTRQNNIKYLIRFLLRISPKFILSLNR